MPQKYKMLFFFAFFYFVFSSLFFAQDGQLDASFGAGGIVTTAFGSSNDDANSVAVQADDKIVVAGYTSGSGSGSQLFAVARYNTDGSLDNTFDGDGKVTTTIGSFNTATSVALQADGKIVVAGYQSSGGNTAFAIVRYNSDGSLDNDFDGDGKVTTAIGSFNAVANSVVVQADGKIVAAGYITNGLNGANKDFAVVRYNSDGSLDNDFDGDGIVTTAIGSNHDLAYSVALQADGKIVAAGYSDNGSNNDFAVVRYNSDGSLDNTFDSDGKLTTAIGSGDDEANSVALQADGKIVAAGYSYNGSNYDFALVRYNSDGSLDNTFDSDGKVTTAIGSGNDIAFSVALQMDGKIVAAGQSYSGSQNVFALARYNSDGSLDNTLDSDGIATTAIGSITDAASSLALQSDGKIVAAGYTEIDAGKGDTQRDFAVALYTGSSGPLPVELTSFTASVVDDGVELNWSTATEVNNYGFEIERKAEVVNGRKGKWEKIGFVNGHGNSNSQKYYSFVDENPYSGTTFYRLKQIDFDGAYEYSETVGISFMKFHEFELEQNYPNPFNPATKITFIIPGAVTTLSSFTTLKVYDILGNEITTLVNEAKPAGKYEIKFDASKLSSGIYYYTLSIDNFSKTKKMLLLK